MKKSFTPDFQKQRVPVVGELVANVEVLSNVLEQEVEACEKYD